MSCFAETIGAGMPNLIAGMLRPLDSAKVLFAVGILLAGHEAFAASIPSFDCRVAGTKAERAICADFELARTDAALASAYGEALRRVRSEPALAAALKREHSEFLKRREGTLDCPDASLLRYMRGWRQWLEAVSVPSPGAQGIWINGSGSIEITPSRKRRAHRARERRRSSQGLLHM